MSPSTAPPPFHPQRVEVTLGVRGGFIAFVTTLALGLTGVPSILAKAEDGSYGCTT